VHRGRILCSQRSAQRDTIKSAISGLSATANKSHIETGDLAAPLYIYSTLVVVIFPAVEKSLNGKDAALSAEMSSGVGHSIPRGSGDERVTA